MSDACDDALRFIESLLTVFERYFPFDLLASGWQ